MARKSAEAIAAAQFRAGGRHPEPPADLNPEAAKHWRSIVECRPVDFFRGGQLEDLERLCRLGAIQRIYIAALEADPSDATALKNAMDMEPKLLALSTKLRITVQSETGRHGLSQATGKISERGTKLGSLLGGYAIADIETRRRP